MHYSTKRYGHEQGLSAVFRQPNASHSHCQLLHGYSLAFTFTFSCKSNKGEVILGYSKINSNRISINVECECDGDVEPISFSAKYLKEILNANKGAKSSSLKISPNGLAHVSFENDGFKSNYYLVEIK